MLLDEIEKAHPDMMRKFLVAWNNGIVSGSGSGRQVSCTDAIFVLTSNAASDALPALSRETAGDERMFCSTRRRRYGGPDSLPRRKSSRR